MAALPHGTVTFLFTDIEGSTRLLKELGPDRFSEILGEHARLLEDAFAAHDGEVVDSQGDAFFVAFRTAADAVAAAVAAQRQLAAREWPPGCAVKVRIGLHTGEPRVGDQRYVGIGVHRAARIGAAGHGGQVLLSTTTKELVEEDLPAGVSIRDLGKRRLKDIDQPQHVYQLDVVGLQQEFAQLRTLDVERRRKRRRLCAGAALAGAIAAAVAVPIVTGGSGSPAAVTVAGNAVAVIDPHSNRVTDGIPVGARPGALSFGSGALWVANQDDQSISRIDPGTRTVTRTLTVGDTPTGLATGDGAVWVVGSDPTAAAVTVKRIDPQFDDVTKQVRIPNIDPGGAGSAATFGRAVWIAPSTGLLTRLDPNGRVAHTIDPNAGPTALAVGPSGTWFADSDANTVTHVDATGLLTTIPVLNGPAAITLGDGGVWVADALNNLVDRIDPATQAVTRTITVGQAPVGITVGDGSVWVANSGDGTISRIDPASGVVTHTIQVGGSPQSIVASNGLLWVTVDRRTADGAPTAGSGGTLRLSSQQSMDSLDPAVTNDLLSVQLLDATCAKLLNYPDKAAPAGSQLEPEVAQSLPTRSDGGKVYTFTIRQGFRFSPPSDEPVTAETFKDTIDRSLSPEIKGPAQTYMHNVVGADAYMSGHAPRISGVTAHGDTLRIRLKTPEPDLSTLLAQWEFCAVPPRTPRNPDGVTLIPSAGPYYVTENTPGQGVVLQRNPNYTGSRPHHFDRIVLKVGALQRATDSKVERGIVDYAFGGVDPRDAKQIASRDGPTSPAAHRDGPRYLVNPTDNLEFIDLNTDRPLFRNARIRRAVNFAINRRALVRHGGLFNGEPEQATDQYLPPAMPGYKKLNVYPLSPNVTAAKRLAGSRHRTAILYTCNRPRCRQEAQVVKTDLGAIGIHIVSRTFPAESFLDLLGEHANGFDLALTLGWNADYPDPDDFLNFLLENFPGYIPPFNDPGYKRQAEAASRLTGPRRYLAYSRLDAELTKGDAPWIPIGNDSSGDFFSARIGCQIYQPVYGMDLAALCLKH